MASEEPPVPPAEPAQSKLKKTKKLRLLLSRGKNRGLRTIKKLNSLAAKQAAKNSRKKAEKEEKQRNKKSERARKVLEQEAEIDQNIHTGTAAEGEEGGVQKKEDSDGKGAYDQAKARVKGVLGKLKPSNWLKLKVDVDLGNAAPK